MRASIALALSTAAAAQTPAAPDSVPPHPTEAPAAPADCEFHVWPGDGLMSTYYGWFHAGTVNGQIQGRPGYPAVPPNPIDTATQGAILAEAQPQRLMSQRDHRLIVHEEALPSRAIRTTPGRLSDSSSSCYAELVVDDVILQQDWLNGSFLKILFRYRDFGPDAQPRRSFATWAQTDLSSFLRPARAADNDRGDPSGLSHRHREIRGIRTGDASIRPPQLAGSDD
jgi:hypothetical protein